MLTFSGSPVGLSCWWRRSNGDIVRVRVCAVGEGVLHVSVPPVRALYPVPPAELFGSRHEAAGVTDLAPWAWRFAFVLGEKMDLTAVEILPCKAVEAPSPSHVLIDGCEEPVHRDTLATSCTLAHHLARARLFEVRASRNMPSRVYQALAVQLDDGAQALEPNVRGVEPVEPGPRRYVVE